MRSIRLDQFEFDDSGSEEALELDISRQSTFPHPTPHAFVQSTLGVEAAASLGNPQPFFRVPGRGQVSEYLKRYADIDIPPHSDFSTYVLNADSWAGEHLLICGHGVFIRYAWSTSA